MNTHGWSILVVSISIVSFMLGRGCQRVGTDRNYSLRAMGTTDSVFGPITLTQAFDRVGVGFMDTEFSTVSIGNQTSEIVVYKAKLIFQERYPSVDELEFDDSTIEWKDGCFRYELTLNPVSKSATNLTENSSENALKQIERRRTLKITDRY